MDSQLNAKSNKSPSITKNVIIATNKSRQSSLEADLGRTEDHGPLGDSEDLIFVPSSDEKDGSPQVEGQEYNGMDLDDDFTDKRRQVSVNKYEKGIEPMTSINVKEAL